MQKTHIAAAAVTLVRLAADSGDCAAQLPLSVEQLMVEPARWQWVTVLNRGSFGSSASEQLLQSTFTTALRYGLRDGLEINGRLRGAQSRWEDDSGTRSRRLRAVSAGLHWRVKQETATPALLLEFRADLRSDAHGSNLFLPAQELLFTTYRSIDPVVLSLQGGVRSARAYAREGLRYDPGDSWWLSPQLSVALNASVTLTGGLNFARRASDRLAGAALGPARERTGFSAGVGYAADQRNTLFVSGEFGAQAAGGTLSLQWNYQF